MYYGPTINPSRIEVTEILRGVPGDKVPWPLKKCDFFGSEYTGDGSVGAILDTGCGYHFDIEDSCISRIYPSGGERKENDSRWLEHGTFVSGQVHSSKDGKGVIGAAYNARFLDIQAICPDRRVDPFVYLSEAIDKAVSSGVDAINMSLGSTYNSSRVRRSVRNAFKKGVILVAAAGNSGGSGRIISNYPADYEEVISVGSVSKKDLPSPYTQYSKSVFVSIGGEDIYGILPNNRFGRMSGTSMSSPLIYAVALRWCEKHPEVKKEERPYLFMEELKGSVTDIHEEGWDNLTGWGYLMDVPKIAMTGKENSGLNFVLVT